MTVLPVVIPLIELSSLPGATSRLPGHLFWLSAVLTGASATGRSVQ